MKLRHGSALLAFCLSTACQVGSEAVAPHDDLAKQVPVAPAAVTYKVSASGTASAVVQVAPPVAPGYTSPTASPGYRVQALVHRWVANDLYEYRAVLTVLQGKAYVPLSPPAMLKLPQKGSQAVATGSFTDLLVGRSYQVTVTAHGNVGGTSPDQVLSATPVILTYPFAANPQPMKEPAPMPGLNRVWLTGVAQVTLPGVPFYGQITTILTPPVSGRYLSPSPPERGVAR